MLVSLSQDRRRHPLVRILGFLPLFALTQCVNHAFSQDAESILRGGLKLYDSGDARGAIVAWQQGLEVALREGDELFAGSFYGNIGMAYALLGERAKASEYLEVALRMARDAGDRQGEKNRLNNLASLYLLMGKSERAYELYQEAMAIARDTGDRKLEAITHGNLGQLLHAQSKNKEALVKLRQALALAVELDDRALEADFLSTLGLVYVTMGNFGQGLGHFRRALELGDIRRKIRDHNRLGILEREAGDPRGAAASHRKAGALALQLSDRPAEDESRRLLELALADYTPGIDSEEDVLLRHAVEGLERMLERLRAHGLEQEAREVEKSLLEQRKRLKSVTTP